MIALGTEATPTAAKFKGSCRLCDEPFAKGDMILPVRQMKNRTRWRSVRLRSTKRKPTRKTQYDVAGVTAICLKRPDDPLDQSTLVAAVSGWFFRTMFFKAACRGTKAVKRTLGLARELTSADLDQITPDQNRVCINDAFTYEAAVSEVRNVLRQLQDR